LILKVLILLALSSLTFSNETSLISPACLDQTDDYDYKIKVDDLFSINYSFTEINGEEYLASEVIYDEEGWVSVGISSESHLINGKAVVGIPKKSVEIYDFREESMDGMVQSEVQDLIGASIDIKKFQTIMKFSLPLKYINASFGTAQPYKIIFSYGKVFSTHSLEHWRSFNFLPTTCDGKLDFKGENNAASVTRSAFTIESLSSAPKREMQITLSPSAMNSPAPTTMPTLSNSTSLPTVLPSLSPTIAPTFSPVYSVYEYALEECKSDMEGYANRQVLDDHINIYWNLFELNGEEYISVRLRLMYEGWAAWGASVQGEMLGTLAVIGLPSVGVDYYDLEGYSTDLIKIRPTDMQTLTNTSLVYENGFTYIDFTRSLAADLDTDITLSASETTTYVFSYRKDTTWEKHDMASSFYMNFSNCVSGVIATIAAATAAEEYDSFIENHGFCMIVAWLFLVPIAILMARYGRRFKGWFYFHIILQITAFVMVIVGFIYALNMDWTADNHFAGLHGRLGLAIIIAMTVQIVVAGFRPVPVPPIPPPQTTMSSTTPVHPVIVQQQGKVRRRMRRAWEMKHFALGVLLLLFAYYNVKHGIDISGTYVEDWYIVVWKIAGIAFLVIVVVLEIWYRLHPALFRSATPYTPVIKQPLIE